MIHCGTGRRVINPEKGHHLYGYGADYPNDGVHDDLSVTALYLNDGKQDALLLNFDLIGLSAATGARIRAAVAQATGVKVQNVHLACTHVHSAPDVIEAGAYYATGRCRADYMSRLLDWAVTAAGDAKGTAEECQLRYNFTYVEGNMNRRFCFPDRRFHYIPNNKQLLGLSNEYVDRELGVIAFRKKGSPNRYKAVLTNYACHPLCVGNTSNLCTADFQGALRRQVEATFDGCLCVSTTGAAGDNHPLMPESGFGSAEELGSRLGRQAVMRCYDSVAADFDDGLRTAYRAVALKFKDEATRQMLPEKSAREQKLPAFGGECNTFVSLLGIGPVLLTGIPGELMAEHGAMIKWASPFLKSYVLFTATDSLGYFPTQNQYYWGGYEPDVSLFARGSGEKLVASILDAAQELIQQRPLNLPALHSNLFDGLPG